MTDGRSAYMLSFLAILVQRAGGEIIIENLSEAAGTAGALSMEMDVENDRVILKSFMVKVEDKKHEQN